MRPGYPAGVAAPAVAHVALGWFPDHPGGLTRYLRDLTTTMAAEEPGSVTAVVVGPVADPPPWLVVAGRSEQALPARLARFAAAARRATATAPVVDAHHPLYGMAAVAAGAVGRRRLVVHFHGPWADELEANGARPGPWLAAQRRLERALYRRADAFVVLSEAFGHLLAEGFGVERHAVHVLGAGVDLARFGPGDRAEARRRLGLDPRAWVALSPRRLDPRMGLDVLVEAWARPEAGGGVLLVAGDGPERGRLEAAAAASRSRVRFLGRVSDDDLVAAYRAADVTAVPSVALEGFGLVVLESLACGTPVVGTRVGGLAEILDGLGPGLAVAPGDVEALAGRLAAARSGTAPLPSPAACRAFAARWSWAEVGRRHRDLYARLTGGGAGEEGPVGRSGQRGRR